LKKTGFFLLILLIIKPAIAQDLEWRAGFDGFLDNREYKRTVNYPQTIFGARAWLELGSNIDKVHQVRAGLNYMYEFGSEIDAIKPLPVLYYHLDWKPFSFYIGAFPRRNLLDYPLALLTDTLNYYRPDIEGLYLSYNLGSWGWENVFIDWTGRQTDNDPEQFMFGFSGRLNYKFLYFSHYCLMGHFARPGIRPRGFHIRDNGGFDLNLGADLSDMTIFDTIYVSAGMLISLDRIRHVYDGWETPAGFFAQANICYRGIGVSGTYYRGQGHEFLYGDSFYRAKEYGRLDLSWQPFKKHNVTGKIVFSMHFIEQSLYFSQQVLVSINIGGNSPVLASMIKK
jgi:hypothetical protein